MDLGLANRTIFVTGASGGIGRTVVAALANEKANVVVHCHRNRDAAMEIAESIGHDRSLVVQSDLRDENQVAKSFAEAVDRFQSIDGLIANAGKWPSQTVPIRNMSLDQWNETVAINLTGVFLCCREFLRHVEDRQLEDPSVILIGSTAAVFGEAGHADYAASKSGLTYGLMLSIKNELAQTAKLGRVNCICPGWTITPMTTKFSANDFEFRRALTTIALRKVARPEDIAQAAAFLSSPTAAGHITGQVLVISGGMEGRKLYDESEIPPE